MSSLRCKSCNRVIEWIEVEDKKIPIEPQPATYRFNGVAWVRSDASVNHLAVCSHPVAAVVEAPKPIPESVLQSISEAEAATHWWKKEND